MEKLNLVNFYCHLKTSKPSLNPQHNIEVKFSFLSNYLVVDLIQEYYLFFIMHPKTHNFKYVDQFVINI
jgi:hypothetical protein